MLCYFNYTTCSQLPLNHKFASSSARLRYTVANGTIRTWELRRKEKKAWFACREVIQLDVQAANESTRFVLLQGNLFIGPIFTREKQEAWERRKTFISQHLLEEEEPDFIGPINIHYYRQRLWTFYWSERFIVKPDRFEWETASNQTRILWENWWEACESLIKEIQLLPFNYLQVALV